jgi:hypothetical protein
LFEGKNQADESGDEGPEAGVVGTQVHLPEPIFPVERGPEVTLYLFWGKLKENKFNFDLNYQKLKAFKFQNNTFRSEAIKSKKFSLFFANTNTGI